MAQEQWSTPPAPPDGWSAPQSDVPQEMSKILSIYGVKPGAGLTIPEGVYKGRTFALGADGKTVSEVQRGNAQDQSVPRPDSNVIQAQTRFGTAGIAPEDLLIGTQMGKAALAAVKSGAAKGVTSGVIQGLKSLSASTMPYVKFRIAKAALEAGGVPGPIAEVTAYAVSGYSRKGAAPAEAAAAEAPHVPTAEGFERYPSAKPSFQKDITASAVAETSAAASPPIAAESAASQPVAASTASTATLPKTLNELAIQARRQGVKLSEADYVTTGNAVAQGKTPAEAVAALKASQAGPQKLTFTAPEFTQYGKLRKAGQSHQEAMDAIEAGRAFNSQFNLDTPTVAETKFPKGNRGKVSGS